MQDIFSLDTASSIAYGYSRMTQHELPNYPLYWFATDGTPSRKEPTKHGRNVGTQTCTEYQDSRNRIYYKLVDAAGRRCTVYKHSLANAIATVDLCEFLYPLPGFRSYSVSIDGTPFRVEQNGTVRQLNADIGARRERFVLYDSWGRRRRLSRSSLLWLADTRSKVH